MNDKLNWEEYYDDWGNTYWEAPGIYTDELGSPDFYYRIRQRLEDNKIYYYEDSSPELWLEPRSHLRDVWGNVEDAKYDMYRDNTQNIKAIYDDK